MPPTLIGFAFCDGARPKHVPYADYYDLLSPNNPLREWKIALQGSQLVLVSPPGWKPGQTRPPEKKVDAPSTLIQIARVRVDLYWSGGEADIGALERWPVPGAKP